MISACLQAGFCFKECTGEIIIVLGKISCKELKAVLNSIGEKMTEREFAALIREADIDGDGSISFDGNAFPYVNCSI
ncbi:hypothetical protein DPMN_160055 [Dreissena polymorpha]|uniref:EF-hand domain-containing protein n=1 Tax=Dreissena polymorpha TaxID=45954 RepID=A0A9D4EMJ0_DREPO|nr:hypothetical protein DPMN_160055 [Dreissena polymorpha]